jgi:methylenetetrahydrofolate dehydrogenase (NADP+) / methenyltetrahydrofolate cyclohydrolase
MSPDRMSPDRSSPGRIIDGRAIAARITEQTASSAAALRDRGVVPALAIVVPNDDPGPAWYVRSLRRLAARVGVECRVRQWPGPASAASVLSTLTELSADPAVHGIICPTPLPGGLTPAAAGARIAVAKDVDGANPASLGGVAAGVPGAFAPATAAAVMEILDHQGIDPAGRAAVVVGRSTVVGKPAALLLLAASATVTVGHSRTRNLAAVCRTAEILVVAAGRPHLIGAEHVAPGAVVIDVGTNATEDGGLTGDVDTAAVEPIAAAVTPVPGGVGPVTTALLMRQTVYAAQGG